MQAQNDELDDILGGNSSALDIPLTVSLFNSHFDKGCKKATKTLRGLAELIHNAKRATKKDLPMLKLAEFGNNRGAGGAVRNDANMLAISGVEGDYDGGIVTVKEARTRLEAAGLAALVVSTPSHTQEKPRWRVYAITSGPVATGERAGLCGRLNGALGGILANESFNLSQSYYYGRVRGGAAPELELVEGRPIDTAWELDAKAIGRDGNGPAKASERGLLEHISRMEPGCHDSLLSLIGIWNVQRYSREECEQKALAAMEAVPQNLRDARWEERYRDISRKVTDIYKKDPVRTPEDLFDDEPELAPKATKASTLKLFTPDECANAPRKPYVVKEFLASGDVACIYGAPGAGKSLIAPHIAYAVAQGRTVFGMRTKAGTVLYVAAEDPNGMKGRISALRKRYGSADRLILVEGVSDLLRPDSPDLAALMALIQERNPSLVFIDTLAIAFPGLEENSSEGMGRVNAVFNRLASNGACVVPIHHDTKAKTPTPRGHSSLDGALFVGLQLLKGDDGIVRGKFSKNRNGSCDRELAFRIATEVMGTDEDGDPEIYALVNELDAASAPPREKYSASEKAALAVLAKLRRIDDRPISECEWREACVAGRTVSASDNEESRVKAFLRAKGNLARRGKVIIEGGMIGAGIPTGCDGFDAEGD